MSIQLHIPIKKGLDVSRDYYVDNVRGLVTISIIFIHTVFWSGYGYVPQYLRNASLFIDVPIFFLLTGMTAWKTEKFNAAKQIYKLIIYFTIFTSLANIITGNFKIEYVVSTILLKNAIVPSLPVVDGSYWFVPVYCACIILFSILKDLSYLLKWAFLLASALYYLVGYFGEEHGNLSFMGVDLDRVLFLTSCILIGFMFYKYKNCKFLLVGAIASLVSLSIIIYFNHNAIDLQKYKFPVGLPYVLASLFSIMIVLYGFNFKRKTMLSFIGENSIFFYMSQGIGASIIYYIIPLINFHPAYKLALAFCSNLIISLVIGYLMIKFTEISKAIFRKYQFNTFKW